jgi:phosphatidate phosphatase PAH1
MKQGVTEKKEEIDTRNQTITQDYSIGRLCCSSIGPSYGEPIGLALDAIVVSPYCESETDGNESGIVASSDFQLQFPPQFSTNGKINYRILLQINGNLLQETFLCMKLPTQGKGTMCVFEEGMSTKPSSDKLQQLVQQRILSPGRNLIRYILVKDNLSAKNPNSDDSCINQNSQYTTIGQTEAYVYLWSVHDTIIISDIDGTVTKSDVRGVIDSIFTEKYGHVHEGVCSFFSEIVKYQEEHESDMASKKNGKVRVLYLSSRPMRLIHSTRKFLSLLHQTSQHETVPQKNIMSSCMGRGSVDIDAELPDDIDKGKKALIGLPPGPIFLHTGTLSTVLVTELVRKSTHEFKADLLARQVVLPFVVAGKEKSGSRLFLAGFGNKKTDSLAYEMVGMKSHDIYIINASSVLVSTSASLEFEDEAEESDNEVVGCFAWEQMVRTEDLSFEMISVSNPSKATKTTSQKKRHFKGYNDPKLKKELLRRISSY